MKEGNITQITFVYARCMCCHRKNMPSISWKRKDSGEQMVVCSKCCSNVFMDDFMKHCGIVMPRWNDLTDDEKEMIVLFNAPIMDEGEQFYE